MARPPDLRIAARTTLELIATVMDAAFETLGEGVVLGTMPAYLQSFGAQNARYLDRRFGPFSPGTGATAALAPINFVSRVTGTPYEMPVANTQFATKRITNCEFVGAFQHKSPFARTMICQLHRAIYQGSVNALLPKGHPGYDVALGSRILFGDAHCDFEVSNRAKDHAAAQPDAPPKVDPGSIDDDALAFYTAILVAFVDYLSTVLPPHALHDIVAKASVKVGAKVHQVFLGGMGLADPADATDLVAGLLTHGGRSLETSGRPSLVRVTACPLAQPIQATTKARGPQAPAVREAVCLACKGFLQGAVDGAAGKPGRLRVVRDTALTLGDADCRYKVGPMEGTP